MSLSANLTSAPNDLSAPASHSAQTLIQEAADWYVRLHADDVNEADQVAFDKWQSQSTKHVQIYAEMVALWERFNPVQDPVAAQVINQALIVRKRRSRKRAATAVSLFVLLAASWMAAQSSFADYMLADYKTGIGQQKTIELADQTRITLNTASAVDIEYTDNQRRIVLRRGEVLVNVARDTSRPFVVKTPMGTARALGTIYSVKQEQEGVAVSVFESNVRACTNEIEHCIDLHAGESAVIHAQGIGSVTSIQVGTAAAWTRNNLVVDDQPLSDVLHELSRYRTGHVSFDADKISHIRVSGVFPLNDTDRALSVLVATTPIRIRHFTPYWVTVSSD